MLLRWGRRCVGYNHLAGLGLYASSVDVECGDYDLVPGHYDLVPAALLHGLQKTKGIFGPKKRVHTLLLGTSLRKVFPAFPDLRTLNFSTRRLLRSCDLTLDHSSGKSPIWQHEPIFPGFETMKLSWVEKLR